MAVSLVSGCMRQDSILYYDNITFKPLIGHDTRAVESVPFPKDRTFAVWAVTDNNKVYIEEEQISYSNEWKSVRKWDSEKLNFHACWPMDIGMSLSEQNGLQLKGFDCRQGDVDILVARGYGSPNDDDEVVLQFDHILSRVEFRMLHSLAESMKVRLKKIEMIGFAGEGDYNTICEDDWSTNKFDFSYVVYDAGDGEGIEIQGGIPQYIGEDFYVIPQLCDASLRVTYDVRYGTANWIPQSEEIEHLETYWEPSKHYTYTINLCMNSLKHTTGISSWDNR